MRSPLIKIQPWQQSVKAVVAVVPGRPKPFDAPVKIQLKADRQRFDGQRNLFVAEGNVTARINGGLLQADRLEFDSSFNTFAARGSVRYRKGSQPFQAGSLRFSLIQNEGVFEDVYGVLDLDTAALDLDPSLRAQQPRWRHRTIANPGELRAWLPDRPSDRTGWRHGRTHQSPR